MDKKEDKTKKSIISNFMFNHYLEIILVFIFITLIFGYYAISIAFESDITNEFPTNDDVFTYSRYATNNFNGAEPIIVNIKLDEDVSENPYDTILDTKILNSLYDFDGLLREEGSVIDVWSLALPFKYAGISPFSDYIVNEVITQSSTFSSTFISEKKDSTMVLIYPKKLNGKEDVDNFVTMIDDKINRADFPYGVKIGITGNPILRSDLTEYLESDFTFTIIAALVGIFILLALILRKIPKTVLIMLPLFLGVVWYAAIVVLVGLKLSISTVATGAMILGLGVEYSIFMYFKFSHKLQEHKVRLVSKNGNMNEFNEKLKLAFSQSLGTTGRAILGSAMTTIVAFLALNISPIPMIQHLGTISAIGIVSVLTLSIVFNPCMFILIERIRIKFGVNDFNEVNRKEANN